FRIAREQGTPFLSLHTLTPGQPATAGGLLITPVTVDHAVPTVAFLIDDGDAAVAIVTDTAPTTEVWDLVRRVPHMKAVFLEATFPRSLGWLADVSRHLTTATFVQELAKAPAGVPVLAIHLKAKYRVDVAAELAAVPNVSICEPGRVYTF